MYFWCNVRIAYDSRQISEPRFDRTLMQHGFIYHKPRGFCSAPQVSETNGAGMASHH